MKFKAIPAVVSVAGLSLAAAETASAAAVETGQGQHAVMSVPEPLGLGETEGFDLAGRISREGFAASGIPHENTVYRHDPFIDPAKIAASEFNTREVLGPSWSYRRKQGEPEIAFAALGAGKKGRPGLVHLAIDWNF